MNINQKAETFYTECDKLQKYQTSIIINPEVAMESELVLDLPFYKIWPLNENYVNEMMIMQDFDEKIFNVLLDNFLTILSSLSSNCLFNKIKGKYVLNIENFDVKLSEYLHLIDQYVKNMEIEYQTKIYGLFNNIIINNYNVINLLLKNNLNKLPKPNILIDYVWYSNSFNKLKKGTELNIAELNENAYVKTFDFVNLLNYKNSSDIKILQVDNYNRKDFKHENIIGTEEQFKNNLNDYTFGLINCIPLSKQVIFSGGSLYDIITENYDQESKNKFVDIDIFCTRNVNIINLLETIIKNLIANKYTCYVNQISNTVFYIFIEGIPRMIQLIHSKFKYAEDIINTFDSTHVQNYYNGINVYSSIKNLKYLQYGISGFRGEKIVRIYKILDRNLNITFLNESRDSNFFNNHNYYGDDRTKKRILVFEKPLITNDVDNIIKTNYLNYNELINDENIVSHVEKINYGTNYDDVDKICKMYNFNINNMVCFYKFYNSKLLNILTKNY